MARHKRQSSESSPKVRRAILEGVEQIDTSFVNFLIADISSYFSHLQVFSYKNLRCREPSKVAFSNEEISVSAVFCHTEIENFEDFLVYCQCVVRQKLKFLCC